MDNSNDRFTIEDLVNLSGTDKIDEILAVNREKIASEFFQALESYARQMMDTADEERALSAFSIGIQAAALVDDQFNRIRFMALSGSLLKAVGKQESAYQMYLLAIEKAFELVETGDTELLAPLISMSLDLGDLEMVRGNYKSARQILNEVRQLCYELKWKIGMLWTNLGLANISHVQGDRKSALEYILLAVQLYDETIQAPPGALTLPGKDVLHSLVSRIAEATYYQENDISGAGELAGLAAGLFPESIGLLVILGLSQLKQRQFEPAAETWKKIISLEPGTASDYLNYATTLVELRRDEEALTVINQAADLIPDDIRLYLKRGQIYKNLERYDQAISDFSRVIEMAEGKKAQEVASTPPPPAGQMPASDLADVARTERIRSLNQLGRLEEAGADIKWFIEHGDKVMKPFAYRLLGKLEEGRGHYQQAIDAYTNAIHSDPENHGAYLRRADVYLDQGRINEALPDLAFAARRDRSPKEVIPRLTKVLEAEADNLEARKWRGYAYQENWQPSKAEADLSKVLESVQDAPEIYFWRGMARITYSPEPDEDAWNNSFDIPRVRDAIIDLGTAVSLKPDYEEALAALKWLIDRASADDRIMLWLISGSSPKNHVRTAIPALVEPFEKMARALDLTEQDQWGKAVEEYGSAQGQLIEIGFPVWAARLHIFIADNLTRIFQLQQALDHLERVGRLMFIHDRPLTASLQRQAERQYSRGEKADRPTLTVEIDYLYVYGIGQVRQSALTDIMKAEIFSRMGSSEKALTAMGDIDKFFQLFEQGVLSFNNIIQVVRILRDISEYDWAIKLLKRVEPYVRSNDERVIFLNMMGRIYEMSGQYDLAFISYDELFKQLPEGDSSPNFWLTAFALTRTAFFLGNLEQAAQLDELWGEDPIIPTDYDRYELYFFRAQLRKQENRIREAQEYIQKAIAIVENIRESLTQFESRMSWLGGKEAIYQFAVLIAVANQEPVIGLDFIERAKGRTFVDQLLTSAAPLSVSSQVKLAKEASLITRRKLLEKLLDDYQELGSDYIDFETVNALAEMDTDLNVFKEAGSGQDQLDVQSISGELQRLDKVRSQLRREIEEDRIASIGAINGGVISWNELRECLVS